MSNFYVCSKKSTSLRKITSSHFHLSHLTSAPSLHTFLSFLFSIPIPLLGLSKLNFSSNLTWRKYLFPYTHTIPFNYLTLFVDQFILSYQSPKTIFFLLLLDYYHLPLKKVTFSCSLPSIQIRKAFKARLSMVLGNSLTLPLMIPLPSPHQCSCKSLLYPSTPDCSLASTLSTNDSAIYPAGNTDIMNCSFLFSHPF